MQLRFQRLHPDAVLPTQAHPGDAGFDVVAVSGARIEPHQRTLIPTGFAVAIPEGHAGLLLPRSGLASKRGLTLANSPGLIDAGYRGEVKVAVVNLDAVVPVEIEAGERIAQLVIVPLPDLEPSWVDELPTTERGDGGFGSTGTGASSVD